MKAYQVQPFWVRLDMGAMAIKFTPHSPKFQHYWSITIRLFNIISRTLDGGLPSAEKQSVYSTSSVDWTNRSLTDSKYRQLSRTLRSVPDDLFDLNSSLDFFFLPSLFSKVSQVLQIWLVSVSIHLALRQSLGIYLLFHILEWQSSLVDVHLPWFINSRPVLLSLSLREIFGSDLLIKHLVCLYAQFSVASTNPCRLY